MTLSDVATPVAQGSYDPATDTVTLSDGAVKPHYFRDTLGITYSALPTSGVTMGILGLAGLRWEKWAKWMVPLLVLWILFAAIDIVARPGVQFDNGLGSKFNAGRGNSARSEKANSYPY